MDFGFFLSHIYCGVSELGGGAMTCMEAQQMILPFINDQLTLEQAEAFLCHMDSCADCREELEVYFALLTAMKQLDEDQELSDNYPEDLRRKIAGIREQIRRDWIAKLWKRFFLFAFIFAFGLVSSVQIGELVYEAQVEYTPKPHDFQLEIRILPERYCHTCAFMEKHDANANRYIEALRKKRLRLWMDIEKRKREMRFQKPSGNLQEFRE